MERIWRPHRRDWASAADGGKSRSLARLGMTIQWYPPEGFSVSADSKGFTDALFVRATIYLAHMGIFVTVSNCRDRTFFTKHRYRKCGQ
jgi:hypothetical protein